MKIDLLDPAIEVEPYCWLIRIGGQLVGVQQGVGWCMSLDGRIVFMDSEESCVPLGPVLEVPSDELTSFLHRAALSNPSYAQWIDGFPKGLLLKHIFHTSYSGYWPEKAIAWLRSDPSLWSEFGSELRRFMENKVMPQSARQQAQRMIRSLEAKS